MRLPKTPVRLAQLPKQPIQIAKLGGTTAGGAPVILRPPGPGGLSLVLPKSPVNEVILNLI